MGLTESDIDALELLIDTGAATAGRLSEVMGLTTGAVTRVIDRLEQAGYVRAQTDPADRRRVVVEVVPERVATVQSLLESLERASAEEIDRYSPEQLAVINDFLTRMADLAQTEATRLRTAGERRPIRADRSVGARRTVWPGSRPLVCRSGRARRTFAFGPDRSPVELYRARFDGATPSVRVRDGVVTDPVPAALPVRLARAARRRRRHTTIPWSSGCRSRVGRMKAGLVRC